jgi:hypothetical protein
MRRQLIGSAALLFGLWLLGNPQFAAAADDEVPKDVKEAILKIADLIDKGKDADAKKEAEDLVKKKGYDGLKVGGLKDPMHALSLRSKGGFGVGDKVGAYKPDGIEGQIISSLNKKALTEKDLKSKAGDLKKMGNVVLAVAEITAAATPKKDDGKKKVKDWQKWTKEMQDAAKELNAGVDKADGKAVFNAAKKLDGTCSACHQDFRPAS